MRNNSAGNGCLSMIFTRILGFIFMIFGYALIAGVIGLIGLIGDGIESITSTNNTVVEKKDPPPPPPPVILSKNAYWNDNYGFSHSGTVRVKESDYYSSIRVRNSISIYNSSWYSMADRVIRNDKSKLNLLYAMLNRIKNQNNYSRVRFADIIISFVQDIPYALIDNSQDIYAPVEFLRKYKGDCDTRTILLYIVLKHYNYDVVILNSWLYEHSIIGINLPTSGSMYKYYNGKRYYAWETTYPGWERGWIPREMSNMDLWSVNY